MEHEVDVDVVVVGGGPTGMMLAAELRLGGVRPVVLEQLPAASGLSKALGLAGGGVRALDCRGLAERLRPAASQQAFGRFAHFAGIPIDLSRLGADAPRPMAVLQAEVERCLEARARELGAEVRRGHAFADLRQGDGAVAVAAQGPQGPYELRARFVVGCDGGHSPVRQRAGIGFPGLAPTTLQRLADVTLEDGVVFSDHVLLPSGQRVPFGLSKIAVVPLGGGVYRVVLGERYPEGFDRGAPATLDEFQDCARRVLGEALPIREVRWLSRFTDSSRQAERYRQGRVLLAGDAAHVHLPAGGPGMALGLQDAINLGWKLAAEARGAAPPGLLDSYHAERHPAGRSVIVHTRAQGALMARDERAAALREIVSEMLDEDAVLRRIVGRLHGTDTRYEMGGDAAARHPLVGAFAPDLPLVGASSGAARLFELLRGARGVLLVLADRPQLLAAAAPWADRVDRVTARGDGAQVADALLVRPDGHVAWAASPGEALAEGGLRRALGAWFGSPGEIGPA